MPPLKLLESLPKRTALPSSMPRESHLWVPLGVCIVGQRIWVPPGSISRLKTKTIRCSTLTTAHFLPPTTPLARKRLTGVPWRTPLRALQPKLLTAKRLRLPRAGDTWPGRWLHLGLPPLFVFPAFLLLFALIALLFFVRFSPPCELFRGLGLAFGLSRLLCFYRGLAFPSGTCMLPFQLTSVRYSWSKAPDSISGLRKGAWVRTPLLTKFSLLNVFEVVN
jgi:hypothetical protein